MTTIRYLPLPLPGKPSLPDDALVAVDFGFYRGAPTIAHVGKVNWVDPDARPRGWLPLGPVAPADALRHEKWLPL